MSDASVPIATSARRLLWLTEHYPPSRGGMSESCDRIVGALRARGLHIDLVHFSRHATTPKRLQRQGGLELVLPLDADAGHLLRCAYNDISALHQEHSYSHVVVFGGALSLLAGPVYAAWLNVPLVTLLRGNDFDVGVFGERRREVLRDALLRAATVCAVSRDKVVQAQALWPQVQAEYIPNGLDLRTWRTAASDRARAADLRRQIQSAQPGPELRIVGLIGQIKPKKGGLLLLQALLRSGVTARLHLLLIGECEPEVLAWLQAHSTSIFYTLRPTCDRYELLSLYPACDVVALPSYYDGMPNVMLEAAGLGIPLLAARTGGMADLLREPEHGFLFPPGDVGACAEALGRFCAASVATLQAMGTACQQLVSSQLTIEREANSYLSVFAKTQVASAVRGLAGDTQELVRNILPKDPTQSADKAKQ